MISTWRVKSCFFPDNIFILRGFYRLKSRFIFYSAINFFKNQQSWSCLNNWFNISFFFFYKSKMRFLPSETVNAHSTGTLCCEHIQVTTEQLCFADAMRGSSLEVHVGHVDWCCYETILKAPFWSVVLHSWKFWNIFSSKHLVNTFLGSKKILCTWGWSGFWPARKSQLKLSMMMEDVWYVRCRGHLFNGASFWGYK